MVNRKRQNLGYYLTTFIVGLLPLYYWRFSLAGIPTNFIELLILLLFLLALSQGALRQKPWPPLLSLGSILLLAGVGVSSILAIDKTTAFGIWKGWFVVPTMFGWAATFFLQRRSLRPLLVVLLTSVLLISLYSLLQQQGIIPLLSWQRGGGDLDQYVTQGRALAFYESPNYLAMYLVPLTILLLGYFWSQRRWILVSVLLIPTVALSASMSQAGYLAMITGVIILLIWRKGPGWAVVATLILTAIVTWFGYRLAGLENFTGRFFIWGQTWQLLKKSAITGIGPGQFLSTLNNHLGDDKYYQVAIRPYALHPHNLYLNLWLSGGLLALIGFGLIIFWIFQRLSLQRTTQAAALAAALTAVLIHGLFDSTYFKNDLAIFFWLLVALSLRLSDDTTELWQK